MPHPPSPPPRPRSPRQRAQKSKIDAPVPPPLPLPHERDEVTGQVDPQPHDVIRQAKKDLDAGLVDTDMRATPGLDAERRSKLVPTRKRRP